MTRRSRIIQTIAAAVIAAAVILGAMLWLSGTLRHGRVEPGKLALPAPPPISRAVAVERRQGTHYADLVGSVQAEVRSEVAAKIVANILEVRVTAGDTVQAGQVVIVLDEGGLRARVNQAKESLRGAEAKRDLAQIEYNRALKLAEQKVATPYELEQWRAQQLAAAADVARSQQALAETEAALADTQIRSPITGIVIDRQAEPGDQAAPGRPLLTIYDPARLRLEASVRETLVGRLKKNDAVPIFIDALKEERMGRVEETVPASDPQSRSFLAKIHIEKPAGLMPGMFARVHLPLSPQERLELPLEAVEQVGQLSLVTALVDGRPQRRAVRLGQVDGSRVEVLAGLTEGETVLLPAGTRP
jgi:membrane fusion protein, multidrug efflux system